MLKRGNVVLAVVLALTSRVTGVAQQPSSLPQSSPEHKKLGVFLGTWKDEAEIKPGLLGPGGKLNLTETCDWFSGGFSVVCHTETTGFLGDLKALTVLTYASEERIYRRYEFNSIGWSSISMGSVGDDTWTFVGESKMDGKVIKSRTAIQLLSPDAVAMKSEMSVDGGPWALVMELKGSRVKQSLTDPSSCVRHSSEGWPFDLSRSSKNGLDKTEFNGVVDLAILR